MSLLVLVPTTLERQGLHAARTLRVPLLLCGMGPVEAALGAAGHLGAGGFRRCLLVGLAGTRDPARAPVGSLVFASAVRNEAVGCGQAQGFRGLEAMAIAGEHPAPDLLPLELPRSVEGRAPLPACVAGTVAAASASPEEAAARFALHPDVVIEEMEGHAVAQACRRAGVAFSMLRAVSNRAGDRDRARWDVAGALATLAAALPGQLELLA